MRLLPLGVHLKPTAVKGLTRHIDISAEGQNSWLERKVSMSHLPNTKRKVTLFHHTEIMFTMKSETGLGEKITMRSKN